MFFVAPLCAVPSNVATPLALYVAKMRQVTAEKAAFVQINNFRDGLTLVEPEVMTVKGRHAEQPWKPIGPGQSDVGVFTREIANNGMWALTLFRLGFLRPMQTDATRGKWCCWPTMLRPFALAFRGFS